MEHSCTPPPDSQPYDTQLDLWDKYDDKSRLLPHFSQKKLNFTDEEFLQAIDDIIDEEYNISDDEETIQYSYFSGQECFTPHPQEEIIPQKINKNTCMENEEKDSFSIQESIESNFSQFKFYNEQVQRNVIDKKSNSFPLK